MNSDSSLVVASKADSISPTPRNRVRSMFSATTMAESTTIPTAICVSIRLNMIDTQIAMAMSSNNWPASSSTNTTGRNTATVVSAEARIAPLNLVASDP